jgi:hypothetical protein
MEHTTIETIHDEKRGCGWRRPGTYLVSGSVSTRGFGVDENICDLVLFAQPVSVDPATILKRGYMYVDGERFVRAGGAMMSAPRVERDIAEAQAFSWQTFGMDLYGRIGHGICRANEDINNARATMSRIAWRDRAAYIAHAKWVHDFVEDLCTGCGDLIMLPATIAAKQAGYCGLEDASLYGHGLTGAGAAVAAAWRLVDASRRLGVVEIAQHAAQMIAATTATADAAYAIRYQPPRYQVAPDILDWVGSTHYPTAEAFIEEANRLGISRRIPGVPKAVVTPWSRGFLAHGNVDLGDGTRGPAVFGYYHVAQMQEVVSEETVMPDGWYQARGVHPVRVARITPERVPA